MARNGAGVYDLPAGYEAVTGETILATQHNTPLEDLKADANAARPIVAGGTGQTTVIGAADAFSTQGSAIASATTTDLSTATGKYVSITGTTTITAFGTVAAGAERILVFAAALTLTHNATSLILPGAANITTAAGDIAVVVSEGSGNWRCAHYQRADGTPVSGVTLGTAQATTSGTSIDFTSIPSWAKKITVHFLGVSTTGTSAFLIQLGDSGGVEATGYNSAGGDLVSSSAALNSSGFGIGTSQTAARVHWGKVDLALANPSTNAWTANGIISRDADGQTYFVSGYKLLSAALDRLRITTVTGTATFDAGSINISYE